MGALLWVFAAVMAYPYLPGSDTDAFKGASVFIGLVIVPRFERPGQPQVMSSFMITYSRALRMGDFVRIGEVEGTVTHVGVLSTKIKTLRAEEVTLPNAVVVATNTTNYSRLADGEGVYTPTSVTIGYDTPWRQVQSLLLTAAERTPGLRKAPAPRLLIADEPTTALDVTVQAQILDLVRDLRQEYGTAVVLVTHDLGVVAGVADEVAVMYSGRIVEQAATAPLLTFPRHPYTRALLASRPGLEGGRHRLAPIPGRPPEPVTTRTGCAFAPRCSQVLDVCRAEFPPLREVEPGHRLHCWVDVPAP